MSDYTISLKRVCEVYGTSEVLTWFKSYDLEDYLTKEQADVVYQAGVFNYDFLSRMILNHYFFREIAFETPEMFHIYVTNKLKEIMGSYAPIIYSASLSYNPLKEENLNITEYFTKNKTGNESSASKDNFSKTGEAVNSSTGSSNTQGDSNSASYNNSSSLNVASDTPQRSNC